MLGTSAMLIVGGGPDNTFPIANALPLSLLLLSVRYAEVSVFQRAYGSGYGIHTRLPVVSHRPERPSVRAHNAGVLSLF